MFIANWVWSLAVDTFDAISSFQHRVDGFPQLLFVTNAEVTELFGVGVAVALAELARSGNAAAVCGDCGGACCRDIGCELYAPQFHQCPIHALRPLACRFHFCHRFDAAGKESIIRLKDVFLGAFMALGHVDSDKLRWLDTPPLAPAAGQLVAAISPLMDGVRAGSLDPQTTARLLLHEVEQLRSAPEMTCDIESLGEAPTTTGGAGV